MGGAIWLRRLGHLVVPAALCSSMLLVGQEPSASARQEGDSQAKLPSGNLVFKSSVSRVIVDVVVSDSLGRPVPGLSAEDFSISEDGKPQAIRSFDVHDFETVSSTLPALPASLPSNTFLNIPKGPERGPLYVLLLDLLNISVSDQPTARKQLLEFVRNKPEGSRFAIFVLTDHLYQVQGFTEDRNVLAEAVDPKNPHSKIPKIFLYAENFQPYISTPGVLASLGNYLAGLSGHKNLLWFSSSFPSVIMPSADQGTEALSVDDQVKEAVDCLARARVAVYPVDVRGTIPTDNPSKDTAINATYMTEEEIARATGGRAFHDNNNLASALSAATETGGHYYALTYSPSNQKFDGRLRHIKVELTKKSHRLEYRRAYYGGRESQHLEEKHPSSELQPMAVAKASDSLTPNMQHGAPIAHQLLFRAHFTSVTPPTKATREQMERFAQQTSTGRKKQAPPKLNHTLELQTYQIDYTIAARYPLLEVAAAAYDDDGQILNSMIERVIEENTQFPVGTKGGAIYRVQQKFDVPVNATTVRVGVRDVATDNVGALEIKLPLSPDTLQPRPTEAETKP